jgi:hypothetical protein
LRPTITALFTLALGAPLATQVAAQAAGNRQPDGHVAPQATAASPAATAAPAPNGISSLPRSSRVPDRKGALKAGALLDILVYDNGDPAKGFAADAALNVSPFGTTIAGGSNFNSLLTGGGWDVVAVDCPNFGPSGDWGPLINYVNSGGRVVMSFWDWDDSSGFGDPALPGAFDVSIWSSYSWNGLTLSDQGTSPAFLGVTMPNSDWDDAWVDDGDEFVPLGGAIGLAHVGDPTTPVMVRGNGGRTIAAPVIDEAGATWVGDGSGVRLWENLILMIGVDGPDVLVYDENSVNHFALEAAFNASPGGTQAAGSADFDARLTGGTWDAVLMDVPSTQPGAGWSTLISYVNGGGHVALSFWDWDLSSGTDPLVPGAFDVAVSASYSWNGNTLFDSGKTDTFMGVTMPNGDWDDHWSDDGDQLVPASPAASVAHIGTPSTPVMVWGNAGRTLAAPVLDEAGPTWLQDAVQVWENVLANLLGPDADCNLRVGVLGTNPVDYACSTPPVVGGTWVASVDTTPSVGQQTLTTFVTTGLGGPVQGLPVFGYELLILPPYLETTGFGTHNIPLPPDPLFLGVTFATQGARVELNGGQVVIVLLNGQDVTLGF